MDFADISSYQAGADLAAYARAGHDRILIKATEGVSYTNPHFDGWWRSASAAGLARGAYHFARPSRSSGAAEADAFARALGSAGGLGPRDWVVLDVEDPDERGPKAADHAAAFCRRMVELGYAGGVIYSGTWYLGPAGLTAVMLPPAWQWLHLADYRTAVPDSALPLPAGWAPGRLLARQYSETATHAGIPGKSDRNRVLREWLPASAAPALEEDDMPSADEVADALMARLWGQMTERPPGAAPDWYPPRQPHPGAVLRRDYEMTGAALSVATAVREDTAAIRAALTEVLGADHPATAALAPAPPALTVEDLVALAPQVTPADAARVIRAYAPRLNAPVIPTP